MCSKYFVFSPPGSFLKCSLEPRSFITPSRWRGFCRRVLVLLSGWEDLKRDLLKIFPAGLFQMLGPSGKISPKMRILHKYYVSLLELYWDKAEKKNRKASCLSFSTATTFYLVWKHLSSILSRYCSPLTFMFRSDHWLRVILPWSEQNLLIRDNNFFH